MSARNFDTIAHELAATPMQKDRIELELERVYERGRASLAKAFGDATSSKPSLYALAIVEEFKPVLDSMHKMHVVEGRTEAAMALEWVGARLESVEQKARADAATLEIESLKTYATTLEDAMTAQDIAKAVSSDKTKE